MTAEYLSAIASIGTLIVVIITAVAALRQLGTMHNSNQVAALSAMAQRWESDSIVESMAFLFGKMPQFMEDPAFRAQFTTPAVGPQARPALAVLNFFEEMGLYVRLGILGESAALGLYMTIVLDVWRAASPAIAIIRRSHPAYGSFEYLATRARRRLQSLGSPDNYPAGVPRMPLEDVWLAADQTAQPAVVGEGGPTA
jgi:Domain of unknown function (DUF4760)